MRPSKAAHRHSLLTATQPKETHQPPIVARSPASTYVHLCDYSTQTTETTTDPKSKEPTMTNTTAAAPIGADGSNYEQAFDLPTTLLALIGACDAIAQTPNRWKQ